MHCHRFVFVMLLLVLPATTQAATHGSEAAARKIVVLP